VLEAVAARSGLTQTDLVKATGIDRSTLADLVARMTTKGLLERERSTLDARAKAVRLSPEGEAALLTIDPKPAPDRFELIDDGAVVRRSWRVRAEGETALKALAGRLSALPSVCGYVLNPRDD